MSHHIRNTESRVYDVERRSRVFLKHIHGTRELDMEELFWMDESTDDGRPADLNELSSIPDSIGRFID